MELWVKTKELINSLADVTESGSKVARHKIEVANLDRKLGLTLRKLGELTWRLEVAGKTDVLGDPEVRATIEDVRRLQARIEVIRQEVERSLGKAKGDLGKAGRIVKEEAGRTADVVYREAERAASIIKEETTRAASAIKKVVDEKTASRKKNAGKKETTEP